MDSMEDDALTDIEVIAALIGKQVILCPVCGGDGTFDRLWPGNEEACQYCSGIGKVMEPDDGLNSNSERLQRVLITRRAAMVAEKGAKR